MKYFRLYHTLDLKIIGAFPQVQTFVKGYDTTRLESCSKIGRFYCSETPTVQLDFDGLELAKKAKLTDYLVAAYLLDFCGFLVSQRLYNFLTTLKIVEYLPYDAQIYQKNTKGIFATYKWIHYTNAHPEMIDYVKSHFYEDHHKTNYQRLLIRSFEEYQSVQDKVTYTIEARTLVLKKELCGHFDVLRIGAVNYHAFITEPVKMQMEKMGFTGIEFIPADYLIVE